MLTIFACPKSFKNSHTALIQKNAILSWFHLEPRPEIILLGDDFGVDQIADELGIKFFPDLIKNKYGTPLLSSIFEKAEKFAKNKYLCYINSDIVLMKDFMFALREAYTREKEALLVGKRCDLDVNFPIGFTDKNWENTIITTAKEKGFLQTHRAIDYFVFPKGKLGRIPPFLLGRGVYDHWLIWRAYSKRLSIFDLTSVVLAIHQNHDYSHFKYKFSLMEKTPEAEYNDKYGGHWRFRYDVRHATHKLTKKGIIRIWYNRGLIHEVLIIKTLLLPYLFNRFVKRLNQSSTLFNSLKYVYDRTLKRD